VCKYLTVRPIFLLDSEYGCGQFVLKSAQIKGDKLVRLRSNLVLWGSPPPDSGRGKPRKHSDKFIPILKNFATIARFIWAQALRPNKLHEFL
jgi:hypothetical protein